MTAIPSPPMLTRLHCDAQVCTLLNEVITTNVNIQYKLELEIAGMKDEPQNSLSTSEKLGKLKELQKIWLVPRFSNEFIVSCGRNPFQRIGDTVFQLIYSEPAPGMTSCIQAPSRLKSIKRRDWTETYGPFSFPPLHVEVDHEQDLLVAVEGRKIEGSVVHNTFCLLSMLIRRRQRRPLCLHVRSASANGLHPSSCCEVIPAWDDTHDRPCDNRYISVLGRLLLCEMHMENQKNSVVRIWDWTSGALIMVI